MIDERLAVNLGGRAYDILIGAGLLERAGEFIGPFLQRPLVFIITDETVWRAHGARLSAGLSAYGISAETIAVAPGESSKSIATLEWLLTRLSEVEADRADLFLAFGGGVVGDLAGFAAAIYKRGCRFVQVPTTLLAQVDSAVGGKTAVNLSTGKNLVGAFHQPALVLADLAALRTLPAREIRAGYAEIVKYAALGDAAFFAWLEQNGLALIAGDDPARAEAVKASCAMKAAIVARDEREGGERALLNLGHTFAHAIEAAAGYSGVLHGEAVAAGMGLAFDYSVYEGLCSRADAERLKAHLKSAGLPTGFGDIAALTASAEGLAALMRQDKKVTAGRLTLILARRLGEASIAADVSFPRLLAFLQSKLSEPRS